MVVAKARTNKTQAQNSQERGNQKKGKSKSSQKTQNLVTEASVAGTAVAEAPTAEAPVARTVVAEKPVAEAPAAEKPVAEKPVAETPAAETPVTETPVTETPVTEKPVAEKPVAEKPARKEQSKQKATIKIGIKIVCNSDEFGMALAIATKAIAGRPSHPVLTNVLLETSIENQNVKVTGFDLSMGIEVSFSARVEAEGKVCLPAKLLNDIVSRLPSGEVTLWCETKEVEGSETLGEKISCGLGYTSGTVNFSGISPEEFPSLPQVDSQAVCLPSETLLEGLRGTLFATSNDETKQLLTGVHITLDRNQVEFASTDGHRLALVNATTSSAVDEPENIEVTEGEDSAQKQAEVTVPGKALSLMEHLLKSLPTSSRKINETEGQEEDHSHAVEIRFEPGQLIFLMGNYKVSTRTLEGQYPNIHQLIPQQFLREITIERRPFLSAMERIAILADSKNNVVKLSVDATEQIITASVESANVGSGRETVPADVSGEDIEIAFNIKYVIDALKSLSSSDVVLHINRNTTPAIFTPVGGETQKLVLLMPIQLREN